MPPEEPPEEPPDEPPEEPPEEPPDEPPEEPPDEPPEEPPEEPPDMPPDAPLLPETVTAQPPRTRTTPSATAPVQIREKIVLFRLTDVIALPP